MIQFLIPIIIVLSILIVAIMVEKNKNEVKRQNAILQDIAKSLRDIASK